MKKNGFLDGEGGGRGGGLGRRHLGSLSAARLLMLNLHDLYVFDYSSDVISIPTGAPRTTVVDVLFCES